LLGKEVISRIKTISHNCKSEDLVYIGKTKSHGTKVRVNRVFAEADLKILLGDVGFHYYAGYGGGRKSVMPAISCSQTIQNNHAMFIVNVVTNSKGELVRAFAGDLEKAFYEAIKLVDELYRVTVDRRADIVVVSAGGHPGDINLYQAYKGLDNALEVVKRNGTIILVAECPEGHGNQVFYEWMMRFGELKKVEREVKRHFVMGGHKAYYLLKAQKNHAIILVSSLPDYYASDIFKLKTARAVNDAFKEALKISGSASKVWVMPEGNHTLPSVRSQN